MADDFSIDVVRHDDDLAAVAELFREYQVWLDQPVCFQNFEYELANLANVYAPPAGELWLVRCNGAEIGVVGMVPYAGSRVQNACEMKRLYIRDSGRGRGLGRDLVSRCRSWAKQAGYSNIVLETFKTLDAAWSLYASMGFVEHKNDGDKSLNSPAFLIYPLV